MPSRSKPARCRTWTTRSTATSVRARWCGSRPKGAKRCCRPATECRSARSFGSITVIPASDYEGINVEVVRNRCGAALARRDDVEIDLVAGIPDSGTGHAIGYANEAGIPYRSSVREVHAHLAAQLHAAGSARPRPGRPHEADPDPRADPRTRLLFCEDSIVRGTQLKDTIQRLFDYGATEVHMRPACPPLIFGCKFLNFSRSRSDSDLAARKAIKEIGDGKEAPRRVCRSDVTVPRRDGRPREAAIGTHVAQVSEARRPGRGDRPAQGKALHLLLGRRGAAWHVLRVTRGARRGTRHFSGAAAIRHLTPRDLRAVRSRSFVVLRAVLPALSHRSTNTPRFLALDLLEPAGGGSESADERGKVRGAEMCRKGRLECARIAPDRKPLPEMRGHALADETSLPTSKLVGGGSGEGTRAVADETSRPTSKPVGEGSRGRVGHGQHSR